MKMRALGWLSVVVALSGCGMFEAPSEPPECERDPARCFDANVAPENPPAHLGSACRTDDECQGPLRLSCGSDKVCVFASDLTQGEPCSVTQECKNELFCDVESGKFQCQPAGDGAVGTRCDSSASCERNLVCTYDQSLHKHCVPAGVGDLGTSCARTTDCLAGLFCQPGATNAALQCGVFSPAALPNPVWDGLACPDDEADPVAYFRVPRGTEADGDFFRLPFPNDIRRTQKGLNLDGFPSSGDLFGIGIDFVGRYIKASAQDLRGFATNPVVYFRFSKPYTGVNKDSVMLLDLTEGTPEYGRPLSRAWGTSSGRVTRYVCENWVNVRTNSGSPLKPGHTYAAILTTDIRAKSGDAFERDEDLAAMLAASAPKEASLKNAYVAYAPLRAFLASEASAATLSANRVLNAAVFTTQDPEAVLRALRTAVHKEALPTVRDVTVCGKDVTSPCDDGQERVCGAENSQYTEIHGRISLPIFQRGEAPYLHEGGDIRIDDDGVARVVRTEQVCFGLALPKASVPETGLPLVVYAHGTGGSFKSGLRDMAQFVGSQGAAVLSFDLPQHGSRANNARQDAEELFYNFGNPRAARDNVAQGSADLFALVRWALAEDAQADGPFKQAFHFDPSRVVLFGHSQGATHASLALPYENDVVGAVLSGVGGDLSEALVSKKAPIDIASAVPFLLGDREAAAEEQCSTCMGSNHPVLALLQGFFERVDPVNFAPRLPRPGPDLTPKHLFMTYGLDDRHTPESTQRAFLTAASLSLVTPVFTPISNADAVDGPVSANVIIDESAVTQAVRQYRPEAGKDGHFVYLEAAKADWESFLANLLAGEVPVINP